jgi:hypothetical protein
MEVRLSLTPITEVRLPPTAEVRLPPTANRRSEVFANRRSDASLLIEKCGFRLPPTAECGFRQPQTAEVRLPPTAECGFRQPQSAASTNRKSAASANRKSAASTAECGFRQPQSAASANRADPQCPLVHFQSENITSATWVLLPAATRTDAMNAVQASRSRTLSEQADLEHCQSVAVEPFLSAGGNARVQPARQSTMSDH